LPTPAGTGYSRAMYSFGDTISLRLLAGRALALRLPLRLAR
jgi:hypothetical protein